MVHTTKIDGTTSDANGDSKCLASSAPATPNGALGVRSTSVGTPALLDDVSTVLSSRATGGASST